MSNKKIQVSAEELVIRYLKQNINFLVNHPELLEQLEFPNKFKDTNKIIDLNAYRSKKLKNDYNYLKKQMSEILRAASSHIISQKRILKTSLKILNTKSLNKLIDVIVNDLGTLLACDLVSCYFTSDKINHRGISQMDNKIATSYFRDKPQTYLNQNSKGIPLFFPNKSKTVKSYILLKIVYGVDRFIVALGSKDKNKFTKDQQVDLVEYLIQVIQIKLVNLN